MERIFWLHDSVRGTCGRFGGGTLTDGNLLLHRPKSAQVDGGEIPKERNRGILDIVNKKPEMRS
jgi:hypothetical protein